MSSQKGEGHDDNSQRTPKPYVCSSSNLPLDTPTILKQEFLQVRPFPTGANSKDLGWGAIF